MFNTALASFAILPALSFNIFGAQVGTKLPTQLASHTISLDKRYANESVNRVFADNILLTLYYLRTDKVPSNNVNWDEVRQSFDYRLTLHPNQGFAFHQTLLPEYQGKIQYTTRSNFGGGQGFKSDGYLMGDGVCHLASLIYWSAKDANLNAKAPTNHDFANIPEIPREYGVAIYNQVGAIQSSALQNLYITNNRSKDVYLDFKFDGTNLTVNTLEAN